MCAKESEKEREKRKLFTLVPFFALTQYQKKGKRKKRTVNDRMEELPIQTAIADV
jgi:hypothetical protein